MNPDRGAPASESLSDTSTERTFAPFLAPAAQRAGLQHLQRALNLLADAQRQLVWRHKKAGQSISSLERQQALFVLLIDEEATAGQLARESGLDPSSITPMLDRLEREGLVTRRRDDTDRRVSWVSLTDEGRSDVSEHQARSNEVWPRTSGTRQGIRASNGGAESS